MRALAVLVTSSVLALLLVPGAHATAIPVLHWPSPAYVDQSAAQPFTEWFAGALGAQVDPLGSPEWRWENDTSDPAFLRLAGAYVLPLTAGVVEARYLTNGLLADVDLMTTARYEANSASEADLLDLTTWIAGDLGVDLTTAEFTVEYIEGPQGGGMIIHRIGKSPLCCSPSQGWMRVVVRGSDLRVTDISVSTWYGAQGTPDVSAEEALAIALDEARLRYNASDPEGAVDDVTPVRNGTSFVYRVDVHWSGPDGANWTLRVWVDATTGEVVEAGDAILVVQEGGGTRGGSFPGASVVLAVAPVAVIALALFYRLSAERALDQFTRGGIFGYVLANPGTPYTKVRDALDLGNGTFGYHVWILERTGFVRSARQGRLRLLYAEGRGARKGSLVLSKLQYGILDLLHAKGPLSQVEIARHLGLSKQRAHYNVKVLRAMSLVEPTPDGRTAVSSAGAETVTEPRSESAGTAQPSP